MTNQNDDITTPRFRGGILASALSDLQKYDNITFHRGNRLGTNPIPEFRTDPRPEFSSKSFLIDRTSEISNEATPPRLISGYNSPLPTYRGIIGTALRNEFPATGNGYIPSQSIVLPSSEKTLPKGPIFLNDHDRSSLASSFDHTFSTTDSALQSKRYTGSHKENKRGMISRWLQDEAGSTLNLGNKKESSGTVVSPRSGMLGLLLKKKAKSELINSASRSSPDPIASGTNSISKESPMSRKSRSILDLKNQRDKHLSLEDLDANSVTSSQDSTESVFSKTGRSRKDRKLERMKWSTQQSTSKESENSTTSLELPGNEDGHDKSLSSKVSQKSSNAFQF